MVWSACSSGKFKTPCKSKPLDQARHTFNSSSTEFLQALDVSPSYSLSDRCRGFCNPFEPRTGLGQVFNSSTVVVRCCQPLRFFPQAQNVSTKKKQKEKKGWWIHLVCVIYLLSLPNMKYSEWSGKNPKTKRRGCARERRCLNHLFMMHGDLVGACTRSSLIPHCHKLPLTGLGATSACWKTNFWQAVAGVIINRHDIPVIYRPAFSRR